jgi:copper transport protein
VVAALQIGFLAFLLRAEDALQLPLTAFLDGDLSPFANGTRFGKAFVAMELGFAVVAALLFLAWLTERRVLLWPAFLLSLGLGSGLSLSGHQADDRGWLPSFADWVHLSAASLWIGGLLSLGLVVWNERELRRAAFWRFSELAGPLVALLVAAGVYMSFKRFPALNDLWDVGYGQLLLVKLGLVSIALSWGAFHHFVVRPRLDRPAVARRLSRSLVGEAAVAVSILLLAAILADTKPPAKPAPQPTQALTARR